MIFDEFLKKICTPPVLAEKDQFLIKLADSEEEIEQAMRLRYRIFNLEQGKGLESANGIDRDEFDEYCLHLIVIEKKTGEPVGTYRIHLGPVASSAIGFYSAREYSIPDLGKIASEAIEVGRSCVSPGYRTGAVVALLWLGIAEILIRSKFTYLLGCVSLESTEPVSGWALYKHFEETGKLCDMLTAEPMPGFELEKASPESISQLLEDKRAVSKLIPPLFKGYLRLGTKICSKPAFDKEFGTIDFLILLNTKKLPDRYVRHFYCEKEEDN